MDASHYLQFAVMIPYFQLVPEQQRDVLAESQDQLGLPALFLEKDYRRCGGGFELFSTRRSSF